MNNTDKEMARFCFITLLVLTAACSHGAHGQDTATWHVSEVARGTSWVSPYWGYCAPKIVHDGKAWYTAGLWGPSGSAEGVVYKHEHGVWQEGCRLPDIYQPAVILLDKQGRLLVIYNKSDQPAVILRGTEPGGIDSFEHIPAPPGMANAYYPGAAIRENQLYLAWISTPSYTMYLARLRMDTMVWDGPTVMAEGQVADKPKTAWTYPILMPKEEGLHVVASNCPDGGEGNTYNQVWRLLYPGDAMEPAEREVVAESPVGHNAYALDATVDAHGTMHLLHFWNRYVYGSTLPEDAAPGGTYHSWRMAGEKAWHHDRLADDRVWGFYNGSPEPALVGRQDNALVMRHWRGDHWDDTATVLCSLDALPVAPGFMDVLSMYSGSVMPHGVGLVSDGLLPARDDQEPVRVLWTLLPEKP